MHTTTRNYGLVTTESFATKPINRDLRHQTLLLPRRVLNSPNIHEVEVDPMPAFKRLAVVLPSVVLASIVISASVITYAAPDTCRSSGSVEISFGATRSIGKRISLRQARELAIRTHAQSESDLRAERAFETQTFLQYEQVEE